MTSNAESRGKQDIRSATGRPVFTADGVHLGTLTAVRPSRFKVDTPLAPDLWLAHAAVRAIATSYVLLGLTNDQVRKEARADDGEEKPFLSAEGTSHPGADRG